MNNNGTIYLSGGGNWNKTVTIDTHFLSSLPKKEILFLPIAKDVDLVDFNTRCRWLTTKLNKLKVGVVDVVMELDFNKCKNIDQVPALYLGGGNVYRLLKLMNESQFVHFLKEYIQDGGIVYGASSGSVIMGKDISTHIEENEKYNYLLSDGLSFVGDYSIFCHFEEVNIEKIKNYIERKNNPVIGIPEGVALLVKNRSITIIGDGPVTFFEINGVMRKVMPNTTIDF